MFRRSHLERVPPAGKDLRGRASPVVGPTPSASLRRPTKVGIACVLAAFMAAYLSTGSQQRDPDVLEELRLVEALDASYDSPAHMLYSRVGVLALGAVRGLEPTIDALRVLQVVNAVSMAAAMSMLFVMLRRAGVAARRAALVIVLVGFGYATWTHTVDAFFIAPAAAAAIAALACSFRMSEVAADSTGLRWAMLGMVATLSLAVLFFQNNLAIVPALAVASWRGRDGVSTWANAWLRIGVLTVAIVLPAWVYQGAYVAHVGDLNGFAAWFFGSHGGMESGLWRREGVASLRPVLLAWVGTVLPVERGLRLSELAHGQVDAVRAMAQLALVALGVMAGLALVAVWDLRRRKDSISLRDAVALSLFFVAPGATVFWFDRAEIKLWLVPLVGLWVLFALVLECSARSKRRWLRNGLSISAAAAAVLVPLANFSIAILPDLSTPSAGLVAAREATARLKSEDALLRVWFGWTDYIEYACPGCRVINALDNAQSYPAAQRDLARARTVEEMRATWSAGGRVMAPGGLLNPNDSRWHDWVTPFTGLTPDDFANLNRVEVWSRGPDSLYALWPVSADDNRGDGLDLARQAPVRPDTP